MSNFTKVLCLILAISFGKMAIAQKADPLDYLNKKCPKLTGMYKSELGKYHVHYVFAIDVSGTMVKYQESVQPALEAFFSALPDGDRVTIIPFGTDAVTPMDFQGVINGEVKASLMKNVSTLYDHPSYSPDMKSCTNIEKAVSMVSQKINLTTDCKANVVIMMTDFRNDDGTEKKLSDAQLTKMDEDFAAATKGVYTRCVALDLASAADMQKAGYCLPQLRDKVFYSSTNGTELVSLTNPGEQIRKWFDGLRNEIMLMKMSAIIDHENKMAPAKLDTKINIDGKVQAHITWTPSKLYPMMKIGSTQVLNPNWNFINDTTLFQNTMDTVLDLELGQIKHHDLLFHHLSDSLALGIDLPTEYDDELNWLKVKKPLPNTTTLEDRLIFTFPLPLWLTITIIILIILYIIGVIKAMGRNAKFAFKGTLTVYDAMGNQIDDTRRIPQQKPNATISIGAGATGLFRVDGATWQVLIQKKKANPFLVFAKPYFQWKAGRGYAAKGKSRSGKLDYESYSTVKIKCGESRMNETHSIKIQLKK